ncbi:VanW family protein [Herbidospora cretacea]|uniref:VanW family protein n=1 Tax=Herbidospora cretacea TaxID=28444 RepID=UPI0004C35779|nr:VanW family protein [Herbidospora cretacea]
MRNAEASIDPPTDPFGTDSEAVSARKHPVRAGGSLPPGVTSDIFGSAPLVKSPPSDASLPPPAKVEVWPVAAPRKVTIAPLPAEVDDLPDDEGAGFRWVRSALIAVGGLLVLLYALPAFLMAGNVYPGTTVLGVDVGGLNAREATDRLTTGLVSAATNAIVVRHGTKSERISPERSGLSIDIPATVNALPMGFPSPADIWRAMTGGREITPVVRADSGRLGEVVSTQVARAMERPMVEGDVTFDGLRPEPVYPKEGSALDVPRVVEEVRAAYLNPDVIVEVKPVEAAPRATRDGVNRAVAWARRAVAAPVTLTYDGVSMELAPGDIAAALSFVPGDTGGLEARFDAAVATRGMRFVPEDEAPRDATFVIADGRPKLVPARSGVGIDTSKLGAQIIAVLGRQSARTVTVPLTQLKPDLDDKEAAAIGIEAELVRVDMSYSCCQPRVTNIKETARRVNGLIVRPGETFSLNQATGRREGRPGFAGPAEPTAIRGREGQDVPGVSVAGTVLYNAALRSGLEIVEAVPHESFLPPYPAGVEVAVSYPGPDLVWRNNTDYGVLIQASATDTVMTVSLWGTKTYDVTISQSDRTRFTSTPALKGPEAGCVASVGSAGFTIVTTRERVRLDGTAETPESWKTTYRPRAEIVCTEAD